MVVGTLPSRRCKPTPSPARCGTFARTGNDSSTAWLALHRAFDRTAGRALQTTTLPVLFKRAPHFENQRAAIDAILRAIKPTLLRRQDHDWLSARNGPHPPWQRPREWQTRPVTASQPPRYASWPPPSAASKRSTNGDHQFRLCAPVGAPASAACSAATLAEAARYSALLIRAVVTQGSHRSDCGMGLANSCDRGDIQYRGRPGRPGETANAGCASGPGCRDSRSHGSQPQHGRSHVAE